ncbi:major facilitator superfamily domain-containing protein [Bisporella sp. PMI_857]|nr:major facilitator superfamily domain-containing protein [Bisporella sp. PMI_857]
MSGSPTPLLASIILFIVGSAVNGSAHSPAELTVGRTVQGIGAGGIHILIDIVCCDLVALRERGKYLANVNIWAAVAAALGPVIRGVLADTNWRWIFHMNLPICTVPLVLVALFMHVKTSIGTTTSKLHHLDFLGIGIFTVSMVSLLFGLVAGGSQYPRSSWRVILPLILGTLGWIVFHLQQHFFANNPSVPTRLFSNRTSAVGFALNFFGAAIIQAVAYFLPVHFQAVLGTTILKSGINFISITIGTLCFAAAGGVTLSKFGAYRPIHAVICRLGFFQNTYFRSWYDDFYRASSNLSRATRIRCSLRNCSFFLHQNLWICLGCDYTFTHFNAAFRNNLYRVQSSDLRSQLGNDQAYSFASKAHTLKNTVDPELWSEIIQVYVIVLKYIWWFGLAVAILSFFLVGLERDLELSTELTTEYGFDHDADKTPDTEASLV